MKILTVTLCLVLGVLAQDKYEDVSDDFNISEVLNNKRLLMSYTKCLLDKGPCTPEVKKLKDKLPEALATNCAKCTEKHKQMGKQLVQELKMNNPALWKELVAKYDPKGEYQNSFKDLFDS